jgi:sugar lactone lactonase YvrE
MRQRILNSALLLVCFLALTSAVAQTPVALPTTMTTVDSSSSAAARSGMVVDAEGNVFISDDVGGKVYLANQSSGKSSVFVGSASSNCGGAISSSGDGCPFANAKSASNMRSIGIDPYGNVLLAGYGDSMVHILCRAASPLCVTGTPSPSALSPIQIPVGDMGLVAGCTTGSSGTKASGVDNAQAFLTGSSTYSISAFKTSSCTSPGSIGTTSEPYGVTADAYGNVYYSELGANSSSATERWRVVVGPASYNGVTNPIYAVLAKNTAWPTITAGYAYTVADGNSNASVSGSACTTAIGGWSTAGTASDIYGDGCLFTSSEDPGSTSYASGVVVDAAGNMLYTDPGRGLRVLFVSDGTNFPAGTAGYIAGQAMKNAIYVNNRNFSGFTSAVPGYIYLLAGGGGTGISATPTLGSSTTVSSTSARRLAISPAGNVYIGVYNSASTNNLVYFYDMNTGYVRLLLTGGTNPASAGAYCNGGSTGAKSIDIYGDGCPVSSSGSEATFGNGNSELPLAVDAQGNLYIYDAVTNTSNTIVRKVLAQGMAPQTLGTTQTQTFETHFYGASSATSTLYHSANGDMSFGAPSCTLRADSSLDCTVSVTVTPSEAGQRSASLTVANASSLESLTLNAGAAVTGSALTIDNASSTVSGTTTPISPTTASVFGPINPASVAVDGAANVYAASGTSVVESIGGTSYTLSPALTATPSQIAVDATGDIFAVNSGIPTIQELVVSEAGTPSTYGSTTISYSNGGTPEPVAVAVDKAGNLYVADGVTESVYLLSLAASTLEPQSTIAAGFSTIASLAVDSSGNVYVADTGAGAVYKLTPGATSSYTQTTTLSGVGPAAVAVDAAGDVYVQDRISGDVLMVPVSGPATVTVLTSLTTPTGLAVDGVGNVYSADSSNTNITEVERGGDSFNFGTSESTVYGATLTEAGTQAITGSNTVTNTTNFSVTGGSSNACPFSSSVLGALSAGQSCALSAALVGSGSGTVTDDLSFIPSASTYGSLTLTGTLEGTAIATTTTISAPSPASPIYSASGTEATFTVSVTPASGATAPGDTVQVTVDSTITNPTLMANGTVGQATVTITGLAAGPHTISATYATSGAFTGSNSGSPQSFSIGQITTGVSWTPGTNAQPVSQAIGTGVLNAAASPAVAGNFVYTATPSVGSPITVDAATYLPIGSYTLAVTFYPNDSVDYSSSTMSGGSYAVTKANTNAVAGASTNVVASDGSGNFTNLSAALAALPTTGGTVYIKPGTYTGQNAISYPNVALRGLGGDPTKVILSGEDGAFSSPFTGYLGTGTGQGNDNASGDQGSSVLDVSKSLYMGQTPGSTSTPIGVTNAQDYIPTNFYAEYLTVQNTWNTDTTATSGYNTSGGSCAAAASQSLQSLYNSELECNSQALALWITGDQAILNNVNLTSQQDTLYAGSQGCGSACTPARQYMWKGLITGDVDYAFGDAAMVFDHTNFFTTWHGNSATGTETIEAQNKKFETGSGNDYLSGYICNGCTLMSQSTGMTNLYYGRPYGPYSTWIMLNSQVDQVNPVGWIEFSGDTNLPTSTYAEYNSQSYTDPAVGTAPYPATLFGGTVTPTGGNTGAGVSGTRETESADPGTLENENTIKTQLTPAEAAQYAPVTFLSAMVPTQTYTGFTNNWNPVTALATAVNNFANTGDVAVSTYGTSVTILGRPQTPGAGVIPTGTYTFYDGGTQLATGNLDPSGEAYYTTTTLSPGRHSITMVYGGDSNFNGSTSGATIVTVALEASVTTLTATNPSSTYGGTITGSVMVAPQSGPGTPTGSVALYAGSTQVGTCMLTSGACNFSLTGIASGVASLTAQYGGDATFSGGTSNGITINVARAILQVMATSYTINAGGTLPGYAATITGFVNGDMQSTATTGSPALSSTATNSNSPGEYPITVTTGTLAATNYNFAFTGGYLRIVPASEAAAVATGDSRTVTEPQFPAVCQQLNAAIAMVNNDIPTSVDATVTNPDGARIQTALNACSASYPGSGPGLAVELSIDGSGNNAFLSGPLSMPSNVTLLVDPGVVLFFSRNAQDYDSTPGTHTCGTVNENSATSSCKAVIDVPGSSTNVGIMGFGKLDGRGGDTLINAIAPYQGYSWWELSSAANGVGNQQNPRFVQLDGGSSNITLYKITIRNSPLFHVSTTGSVSNVTAWDVKVVTPTTSRNTDGIDPGNVTNFTVTRSWISDGDDNVAVGAAGSGAASNVSITNNHLFAGHGQSIGSITEAGVSNVLFDGNMSAGNGFAGHGSAVSATGTFSGGANDSNSTGIRIKSDDAAGGLVTNIQYSNECLLDHSLDVQFTPLYNTDTGTLTPNFKNILMQNIVFMNDDSSTGTVQFTGAVNPPSGTPTIINPLMVTLDNITFPSALSASSFTTTGTAGTETNAQLTFGPGDVSSNFVSAWTNSYAGANGDTVTNNITAGSLQPPACTFTYIAPELTGPVGLPQTITQGQNAAAIVILTPAVGGAAYPTGTVTLTDALTSNTYTAPLSGNTDTLYIPLSGLSVGTHTFTATYSGDSNYVVPGGATYYSAAGPYIVTVNAGSLAATTTGIQLSSPSGNFGTPVTATATVTGSNPTGSVQFVVSGNGLSGSYTYATVAVTGSGSTATASTTLNLPESTSPYTITAIYSGDNANAGSTSTGASLSVGVALTTTALSVSTSTTTLGHPVLVSVMLSSAGGVPSGTVSLSYTTAISSTPVSLGSVNLVNGSAYYSVDLPVGTDYLTASYPAQGSFSNSASSPMTVTVNTVTPIALPTSPMALAYTINNLVGGGATVPSSGNMNCPGATDKYGDGCVGTTAGLTSGDDLRGIATDPFGNVYFTDISASLIRIVSPNGVVNNFAGRVTGTACTAPVSTSANGTGCTPTLVSLSKPRGVSSDTAGNIYIADYSGDKVYEVRAADGLMYTVAGTGTAATTGDGGLASAAPVDAPRNAWADSLGNIYIADTSGNRIRVVDTAGYIHAFAGTGTNSSTGNGGPALAATISNPQGVMVDNNLNVYIADSASLRVVCVTCGTGSPLDNLLSKLGITSPVNGYIYALAGGASSTYSGTYPTLATNVKMAAQKLGIDQSGNIYISDSSNNIIWFLDARTGYIRPIAANGTVCGTASDSYGDGCPATQAEFGSNGGNGIGTAVDQFGNVYIGDSTDVLIRKVTTNLAFAGAITGSTVSRTVELHFIPGDSLASSNGLVYSSPEWSSIVPACTTNTDTTTDCAWGVNFMPKVPGTRSTPLTVNSSLGNSASLALTGTGLGSGATLDPASQTNFGSGLAVAGLATDNAGNIYVSDSNSKKLIRYAASAVSQGNSATGTTLTTLIVPGAVAVDSRGYAYVADTSAGTVTQISPGGVATTLPFTFTLPAGLAVDGSNNLYVSDSSAKAVYQISAYTGAQRTLALGTLVSPAGLSIDPSGNLLVADTGAPAIYRFNLQTATRSTVSAPVAAPKQVVTDAAGNLLISDSSSILAVPASSHSASFTVDGIAPAALAIDSAGNLYAGASGGVLKLTRTQGYVQYAAGASPQIVNMLDSGNQTYSATAFSQTDSTDYSLVPTASTDCAMNSSGAGTLAVGGRCALTASYTPTTFATTTDAVTFNGNLSNAGLSTPSSVQLTLTGPSAAPTATATLGAFSPASPVYGQTVTLSVTVTSTLSVVPAGSVVFTVDSTTYPANLSNGAASVMVSGLAVGPHSVSVAYTSSNGFTSASAGPTTLTVGKAPQTITFGTIPTQAPGTSLTLTATASSGLAVSYVSTTTGVCTVSGNTAKFLQPGICSITASQAGTGNYNAATSVTQSFSVVSAPTVTLTTTATLSGNATIGYQATVTVTNTGSATANNVQIISATLGAATATTLPVSFGNIAGNGGSVTKVLAFPSSAGADGSAVVEKYSGTLTGGTFSASIRATLP